MIDLIEVRENNAIQIREIRTSRTGKRSFHRHMITAHCENEHPLAHAIRDALPLLVPFSFSSLRDPSLLKEKDLSYPDFIRIQVGTGKIRVDDHVYFLTEAGEVSYEVLNPRLIFPGKDYSDEVEKVRTICKIVHTGGVVQKFALLVALGKETMPFVEPAQAREAVPSH